MFLIKFFLPLLLLLSACNMSNPIPTPEKIPYTLSQHGDQRIDNYYWIRDDSRKNKKMLSYLKSENDYADYWFSTKNDYQTELVNQLMSQVPEKEVSFKIANNDFKYYEITTKSEQLPKYFRSDKDNNEVLVIDPNPKLLNQDYYSVSSIYPSFDNKFVAYAEDNNGRREYTIKIIDAETMNLMDESIEGTTGTIIWTNDNKYIIYLKKDPVTLISNSVYVHEIGSPSSDDLLIYKEVDPEFNLTISLSRTKEYAYINIEATNLNEIRLIDIKNPLETPKTYIDRSENHLYYLEHVSEDSFLVLSNYKAPNFKILKSISKLNASIVNMETLVEHDENVFINNLILVDNFLVLEIREKGLPELSIYNLTTKKRKNIIFNDNAYDVSFAYNKELNGSNFYYSYSSLTTPPSIINYDLIKSESKVLWEKELVGFDKSNYKDQRFFINARDGIEVPVITIAHSSTDLNNAPILFYGYGSYGINIDASFRSSLIPLLDKGFVFSIINIRGGGEMGKHWYEDGRMLNKLNTFNDFNDGVKEVLKKGIGDPNNVFARGGSAGGLLMGGIINMEPGLYKGILSGVPFVDVLTTMSDASIPLTTFEYDEWGNPAIEKEYFYIKQYSPYDNIDKRNYPAVLVTSSLYDSQVQYFEPAKYIAKLREYNQSDNPILMKMNLIGGHGGMSGRINQFKEISEEYNFILNLVD
jgi:oligopeptidase B